MKTHTRKHRGRRTGRNRSGRVGLRVILVLLLGFSLYQYVAQGSISWPASLYRLVVGEVGGYISRPDAGWKRATEVLENLGAAREGQQVAEFDFSGRVVRVADGDTLSILAGNGHQHKVRLFGIDSPERDQHFGQASRRALASMVSGKNVGVVRVETDDYGRTVGTVYLGERNINLAMVEGGYAWWYRRYAPYERHLAEAEQLARENGRGLWSKPQPQAPWNWRRINR